MYDIIYLYLQRSSKMGKKDENEIKSFGIRYDKRVVGITLTATVCVFVLLAFVFRSNKLSIIAGSAACILSVAIAAKVSTKAKLSGWTLVSYAVLLGGTVLFHIVYGAMPFFGRTGYNLMTASFAIVTTVLLFCLPKLKIKKTSVIAAVLSIVLVVSSFVYLFTMNIRSKPYVYSLQKGHDEYQTSGDCQGDEKRFEGVPKRA